MPAAVAFDTRQFVRRLRDAGIDEKQAEAFSEAIQEVQKANLDALATSSDIKDLRSEMREMKARIMGEIRLNRWMLALVIVVVVLPAMKTKG